MFESSFSFACNLLFAIDVFFLCSLRYSCRSRGLLSCSPLAVEIVSCMLIDCYILAVFAVDPMLAVEMVDCTWQVPVQDRSRWKLKVTWACTLEFSFLCTINTSLRSSTDTRPHCSVSKLRLCRNTLHGALQNTSALYGIQVKTPNVLQTKNMGTLKLLHTFVTTRTEVIVLRNKFMYACAKDVCHLWAEPYFDTFHQPLVFVEELWYQPVLQVGKHVTVVRMEIRAVRRVVNDSQLKFSSSGRVWAAVCRKALSWRNTILDLNLVCLHPELYWITAFHAFCSKCPYTVFLVFMMLLWPLVTQIPPLALNFCPRKKMPM
jgi:hypothetical protein